MADGIVTVDAEWLFSEGSRLRDFCLGCRLPAKGFRKQHRLTQGQGRLFELTNPHVLL